MRQSLVSILVLCSIVSCNNDNQNLAVEEANSTEKKPVLSRIPDSVFHYHFKILDSVAKNPPKDTMYRCCSNSVNFMVENTGIDADVEYDYFGATGFKKEDLRKWHVWYYEKYGKKN